MLSDQTVMIIKTAGRHEKHLPAHAQGIAGGDKLSHDLQLVRQRIAAFLGGEASG